MDLESISREADSALQAFARDLKSQPAQPQRPPPSVTSSKTVMQSAGGILPAPQPQTSPPLEGAETKTLYFIEDGVLYTGEFSVSGITEVV